MWVLYGRYPVSYTHLVAVVDGKAYPVVQIVPVQGFYDYENKYKPGAVKETCPAPISEELTKRLQEAAVDGYHALEMCIRDRAGRAYVSESGCKNRP